MQEKFSLCPCKVWKNIKTYPFKSAIFVILGICVFLLDQVVKEVILGGFRYEGSVISIVYVLNDGVAFSMFAFLGEWLKWIQLVLVVILGYAVLASKEFLSRHFFAFALVLGSGVSNLYDRFECGGVVDYIYWHYGFNFAIFNLADMMINLGIALILLRILFKKNTL